MYAAIGDAEETDLAKMPPSVVVTEKIVAVSQNFNGGLSEEQLLNHAHGILHLIASLTDNLKRWAAKSGRDKARIDSALAGSDALKLLTDIWNLEKHGAPDRNGGFSGRSPRLVDVHRAMQITSGSAGVWSGVVLGLNGARQFGDGSVKSILCGSIIDKHGTVIMSLEKCIDEAIATWESLLAEFGLK